MAPILLKIKGTKLFSPFNEIEDVGDLSTLWRVCTKVKDSLENGSRLENLSWRLWHLHQTLEARGKGRDYRKLSPTTTRQLEKTIRRPNMPKAKPMQIKVRLGKAADGSSRPKPSSSTAAGPAGESAAARRLSDTADTASAGPQPPTSDIAGIVARAAAMSTAAEQAVAPRLQPDTAALTRTQPQMPVPVPVPAPSLPSLPAAEEVQVSDFMSFGPSSFLSNGLDLDAPQIEITLDDIFSANTSADWSQLGFGPPPNGQALGMPIPEYGGPGGSSSSAAAAAAAAAAHGMWGGIPYPGAMSVGAAYGTGHAHGGPHRPAYSGPVCDNCGVTSTPLWRRSVDDTLLCNACGLYYKLHRTHRPKSLRANAGRNGGGEEDAPKTFCNNCNTCNTPLWRRDEAGNALCNACGLYYKLHHESRPISLKSDVIRKRQRHDPASGAPRKRPSRAARRRADDGDAATSSSPSATPGAPTASGAGPPHSKRGGSSDGHAALPPPLSAPPVSYSANGTQLLNGAVVGSSSAGSYAALAPDPGHAPLPSLQPGGHRHSNPPQPPNSAPLHRYSAVEQPVLSPGSINIPISPPLTARPDTYFGRAPGLAAQTHLPPFGAGSSSNGSGSSGDADPKHGADRQLPSLAELASVSAARRDDPFRYSGYYHNHRHSHHDRDAQGQHHSQQHHPPIN